MASSSGTVASNIQAMDLADYECPICTEYLWPPIYKCKNNGHSLCKKCITKVVLCPICRENLPIPKIRNKTLEAAVTRSLRPCEYIRTGCRAKVKPCNMEQHKKICKFRTGRYCAFLGIQSCQLIVPLAQLIDHARTAHGIPCFSVVVNQEFDVEQLVPDGSAQNLTRVSWKPVIILVSATSNVFVLRTAFDSGKIRWTIQDILIYRSSTGGDYKAVISFMNPSQNHWKTWTGRVLKHGESLENMDTWFVLPSKNIEGRSEWKLRILLKLGNRESRDAPRPACVAINEMSGPPLPRQELTRPSPAPNVQVSRVQAPSSVQATTVVQPPRSVQAATVHPPTAQAPVNRPNISLPEIPRLRAHLTCGICGHDRVSLPAIVRPVDASRNVFGNGVPYCHNCFSDYRGDISEIFFVVPREPVPTPWEWERRQFKRKEGIYEEHYFIFPRSLGIWFSLRRLFRLVTSRDGWLGVVCDGCHSPILGWRFQCTQCVTLNFCRRCCLEEKKHERHMIVVTSTRRFRSLLKQRLFWKLVVPWLFGLLIPTGIARTFTLNTSAKIIGVSSLVCNALLIALLRMPV